MNKILKSSMFQIPIACSIPFIGGFVSTFWKEHGLEWSKTLKKSLINPKGLPGVPGIPGLSPPSMTQLIFGNVFKSALNWIFGPLLIIIYIAMGYASYRVWKAGGGLSKIALLIYMIQLILSWSWPPILDLFQLIGLASLHFYVVLAFVVLTAILFYQVDKIAGFILLPYIAWIIFGYFFKH